MIHPRRRPLLLVALACALALPAAPAHAYTATKPSARTLYRDGPSGRFLMDGKWLFKKGIGTRANFASASVAGWSPVHVPNSYNATDQSLQSFNGTVAWYRRDFKLPTAKKAASWVLRFESVNYRSRVYLNGHLIGTNAGAYLPFEVRLPSGQLNRGGTNRLVVRVENKRFGFDFPPAGLSTTGTPTGGWWNYGGILREVYLRQINAIDMNTVLVRPNLPCRTCAASVTYKVTVRNYSDKAVKTNLHAQFGHKQTNLGTATVGPKKFATYAKTIPIGHPKLWSPASPALYDVHLTARSGKTTLQRYFLQSGVRSIKVVNGHIMLNGQPLNFRGIGLHEDDKALGFAINNKIRDRELSEVKDLGATLIRSHYPLHPYTQERADQLGILLWSEIPVYAIKTKYLKSVRVRKLAARELATNIQTNGNHPSVLLWSIGNELSSRPGPVQADYIRRAVQTAHSLDPTRPVALAVAGYPAAGCQKAYAPLDVIGINEYFGWYPGPNGQIADRTLMPEYLDSVHACYPNKGFVITETGAEANRNGPVEEKGTYAFQQDFALYHMGVYATKPYLSGAIWWALESFRVRPGWDGGNPRPDPPIFEKSLIDFNGNKKPAWATLQQIYKNTVQLGPVPAR